MTKKVMCILHVWHSYSEAFDISAIVFVIGFFLPCVYLYCKYLRFLFCSKWTWSQVKYLKHITSVLPKHTNTTVHIHQISVRWDKIKYIISACECCFLLQCRAQGSVLLKLGPLLGLLHLYHICSLLCGNTSWNKQQLD